MSDRRSQPQPQAQANPLDGDDPSLATRSVRVEPGARRLALVERVLAASRHDILEPVLQGRHEILAGMSAKLVIRKDSDDELVDLTLWKGGLEILRLAYNINASKHKTWMIDIHPGLPVPHLDPLISRLGDRLEQLRDMRLAKRQARLRSEASEISSILSDLGMTGAAQVPSDARRAPGKARDERVRDPSMDDLPGPR